MEIENILSINILSIKKCDCPRPWCQYFAASEGENGTSYSEREIKEIAKLLLKAHFHLRKLLTNK